MDDVLANNPDVIYTFTCTAYPVSSVSHINDLYYNHIVFVYSLVTLNTLFIRIWTFWCHQ